MRFYTDYIHYIKLNEETQKSIDDILCFLDTELKMSSSTQQLLWFKKEYELLKDHITLCSRLLETFILLKDGVVTAPNNEQVTVSNVREKVETIHSLLSGLECKDCESTFISKDSLAAFKELNIKIESKILVLIEVLDDILERLETRSAAFKPDAINVPPPSTETKAVNFSSPSSESKKDSAIDKLLAFVNRFNKEKRVPKITQVQFSAVASQDLKKDSYYPIDIVMYEEQYRSAVEELLLKDKSNRETRSGYLSAKRFSKIKIILSSPEIEISDCVEERTWSGKYLEFSFCPYIPKSFEKNQALFVATVYIDEVIATRLKIIAKCTVGENKLTLTKYDIKSAFVSYSSKDRYRVAATLQGIKLIRPDLDLFFDVDNIRSGENWESLLKPEVEKRDTLFLCWSKSAKESKWVDMEWRYAFETKGESHIEPIPIDRPDVCPPPKELQHKHFGDRLLYIINSTESDIASAKLIRNNSSEKVKINKSLFTFGNDLKFDYYIFDSQKLQFDIISGENGYFIVNQCGNILLLNGEALEQGIEKELKHGSLIALRNVEYTFSEF